MTLKNMEGGKDYPFKKQLDFIEQEMEITMKSNDTNATKGISKLEYNTMIAKITETLNFRDRGIDKTTEKIAKLKEKLNNWGNGGIV